MIKSIKLKIPITILQPSKSCDIKILEKDRKSNPFSLKLKYGSLIISTFNNGVNKENKNNIPIRKKKVRLRNVPNSSLLIYFIKSP